MGENIGAVARVMSNFNYSELKIVNPRDGWPNHKANDVAAHGVNVVERAKIFGTFSEAIADINYLFATTANNRDIATKVMSPIKAAQVFSKMQKETRVGIVFGRERSGLSNEEISFCNSVITINTIDYNTSLNLAQAVCVVLYEFSKLNLNIIQRTVKKELATQLDISALIDHLITELDGSNFFQVSEKREGMIINLRSMLMKIGLSAQDVRTMRGIIKALSRKKNNI
jgi:tRNA/rRNA methyltransferase